ncbi:MAG: substrate-binding domain-containing protein [Chloroflexota bacterium]
MTSRLSRRDFLKMAGVTATGTVLASCAPPAAPSASSDGASPTQEGGEVTIVVGAWAQDSHNELIEKLNFGDTGYTVNVEVLPSGDQLAASLTAGIASGASPYDVMDFEDGMAITYSRSGFFEPLDDLLPADFWEDFPQTLLDVTELWDRYEGDTFRIHHNFEAQYCWYRKDWFDAEGVEPPKTWDDIIALADVFTDEENNVWAIEEGLLVLSVYQGYLTRQAGGNYFDVDETWATALQYLHDLIYVHKAMSPAALQKGYDQQNADYTADKVAYMRQWPFFYDVARANEDWFEEDKVAVTMPPVGPGGPSGSTYAAGWGYGIMKSAPNAEGARELLKFLVDIENVGEMALIDTWYLSNRHSVLETVGDEGMAKHLREYTDAGIIGNRPFHPKFSEASTKLDEAASAFLTNQISLDECLSQGQAAMEALEA